MTRYFANLWTCLVLSLAWHGLVSAQTPDVWELQKSGVDASLRGLSVVDESIAWASGTGGTVIRTIDGGVTWENVSVAAAATLDLRDVQAFGADRCVVISAGSPGCVFRTVDGGTTWECTYRNESESIFFDAMAFWDDRRGLAFSDPQAGRFFVIATSDGGETWIETNAGDSLVADEGEGGFAASGTCLAAIEEQYAWIATGGKHPPDKPQQSRVFATENSGTDWSVVVTPIRSTESAGIFSLAFANIDHGVAVGGDYLSPEDNSSNVAITDNGGLNWRSIAGDPPGGYRSAVAVLNLDFRALFVAVGPTGTDCSTNWGNHWHSISKTGFHAVAFAREGAGWAVGSEGRVAKWIGDDAVRQLITPVDSD